LLKKLNGLIQGQFGKKSSFLKPLGKPSWEVKPREAFVNQPIGPI